MLSSFALTRASSRKSRVAIKVDVNSAAVSPSGRNEMIESREKIEGRVAIDRDRNLSRHLP